MINFILLWVGCMIISYMLLVMSYTDIKEGYVYNLHSLPLIFAGIIIHAVLYFVGVMTYSNIITYSINFINLFFIGLFFVRFLKIGKGDILVMLGIFSWTYYLLSWNCLLWTIIIGSLLYLFDRKFLILMPDNPHNSFVPYLTLGFQIIALMFIYSAYVYFIHNIFISTLIFCMVVNFTYLGLYKVKKR